MSRGVAHLLASAEAILIANLKATFPGIYARPLHEHRHGGGWTYGVWTGGEALMPDGLPIFSELHVSEPEYDGTVHAGFLAWLVDRGWTVENFDGLAYFIVPCGPDLPEGSA